MFKDLFSHMHTIYRKVKLAESSVNPMAPNNPISGYLPPAVYNIPPAVYDQLMAFKTKRGLQSIEMAVTVILSEYFGLSQEPAVSTTDVTDSRLETLEAKCTSLSDTVAELQATIVTLQASSSPPVSKSDPTDQIEQLPFHNAHVTAEPASSLLLDQGGTPSPTNGESDSLSEPTYEQSEPFDQPSNTPMTQAALAKRLSVNTSTISRMQSKSNFSKWSQQKDPEGIAWVRSPDTKLFYPQIDD